MSSGSRKFYLNIFIMINVVIAFAAKSALADCDEAIKSLRTSHLNGITLCDLQNRYRDAINAFKRDGIQNPEHIGNIFATRFINKPSWEKYLSHHEDSEYAAWRVYSPSPTTWGNWAKSFDFIMKSQTGNLFREKSIEEIKDWILNLHQVQLTSLLPGTRVGKFRTNVAEIIPLHRTTNAYTADEIDSVRRTTYSTKGTGEKLMKYELRSCEDLDTSANGYYFRTESEGPLKACGDLTMTAPESVLEQVDLWTQYVQNGFRALSNENPDIDIIEFAATVQQWFVVIHPFVDGNGRISRLMMDLVFKEFGLPAPVLDDMNQDFFTTPLEWADHVGKGLLNSVEALESCVQNLSQTGCKQVSDNPPPLEKENS